MTIPELKQILISFADNESDVVIAKGKLLVSIRGEVIEATITAIDGELYINERGSNEKVLNWIADRVANLHQLADRILDYTQPQEGFIDPKGILLEDIEIDPTETEKDIRSVRGQLSNSISNSIAGTSQIIYITSDAGEGKTTVINHLARWQANAFKDKKIKSLVVPIPLGGRPFLRFDDIVIASLVNRLRFRLFYYDSFIELVKLGLIIPAFDGFEEMFMESSSGEALSATGNLINKLHSSGTILIAARKAYFDYKSFTSQAKLFDTIGSNSVSFSKIIIKRWDREQFVEYAIEKNVTDPEKVYDLVKERLGNDEKHPLLTRPILVNRLLNVVKSADDINLVSNSLQSTNNYFPRFVEAIIQREAETKWIDRSGEPFKPLLSVKQHYELLALLAEEMWINNTDSLHENVLDLIAELYSDIYNLPVILSRQVKERLKQHALIIKSDIGNSQYKFDHDEFREFFLGYSIYNKLDLNQNQELKNMLRKGILPIQTLDTINSFANDKVDAINKYVRCLKSIQINEGPTSFIRENNGALFMGFLNRNQNGMEEIIIDNCLFPTNSLYNKQLKNIQFKNCYFQSTNLKDSIIKNCLFDKCVFDNIGYENGKSLTPVVENSVLKDCEIISFQDLHKEISYYDPYNVSNRLETIGFTIEYSNSEKIIEASEVVEINEDLELIEKALRRFMRSTFINDNIFKMRLGSKSEYFFKNLLPQLIDHGIIEEVEYIGAGSKRRFKLIVPFEKLNYAFTKSESNLDAFFLFAKS